MTGGAKQPLQKYVRRGIAAIEKTKRAVNGIPAEIVIAKLEAKLAAARTVKGSEQAR